MTYYAIDYVGPDECQLVYDDQLYATEQEAEAARPDSKYFEVNWYGYRDLEDVYNGLVTIDENLQVHSQWE
jgi:hypothetical protein